MDGYWCLATPYSKVPGGIDAAFEAAAREAALYVKAGIPVVSPIAHWLFGTSAPARSCHQRLQTVRHGVALRP